MDTMCTLIFIIMTDPGLVANAQVREMVPAMVNDRWVALIFIIGWLAPQESEGGGCIREALWLKTFPAV